MKHFVFFLEEESARRMLEGFLPHIAGPEVAEASRYIVFEGKQDLEKNLVGKMRNYLAPGAMFVVLRDQDAADCDDVRARLVALCEEAGREDALVRVACRELESWYLGDLAAVERGLGLRGIVQYQGKRKFRQPDTLHHPSRELTILTKGAYQKVSGSRKIGPHLQADNENSASFKAFVYGLRRLLG